MLLYTGFRYSEVLQKIYGSLSAVRTIEPSVHCSIRLDDVPFRPDAQQTKHHPSGRRIFPSGPLLFREATFPACIRPDVSAARPDASQ